MFTRDLPVHQYGPDMQPHVITPGAIVIRPTGVFNSNKNVTAAMAIARPNSSPAPDGAPHYISGPMGTGSYAPNGKLMRGGAGSFSPSRPSLEMDPSDPSTWQREYRFT